MSRRRGSGAVTVTGVIVVVPLKVIGKLLVVREYMTPPILFVVLDGADAGGVIASCTVFDPAAELITPVILQGMTSVVGDVVDAG